MKILLKQKTKAITIVILLGFLLLLAIKIVKKPVVEQDFVNECKKFYKNDQVSCFKNKVLSKLDQSPSSAGDLLYAIWRAPQTNNLIVDLRAFSPLAHEVGMELANKNIALEGAINYCGHSFKDACIHGVIMEYIDKNYFGNTPASDFIGLCNSLSLNERQYKNCAHAIGHELRAKVLGSDTAIVVLCDYFKNQYRFACASGVFMEASTGNSGTGYHSHAAVGKTSFDCLKILLDYRHICYSSAGSYRQYEASREPWQETFKFCSHAPKIYQADCFAGADERLLMAKSGRQAEAEKVCINLGQEEKTGCMLVANMSLDSLQ